MALFLTNGAIYANLVPRLPEIKAELGLSNAAYGLTIAAMPIGSLIAGLAAGLFIQRFGSARVAVFGTFLSAGFVFAAAVSQAHWLFVAALFLQGSSDAVTDVAQNAHGLRVQRRYGKTILNSFHAVWSLGAVLGGLMAAGALALSMGRPLHIGISSAIFIGVALFALRFCLPGHDIEPTDTGSVPVVAGTVSHPIRVAVIMAALALIGISGALVEEAGNSWAALYLSGSLGAPASVAAFGLIAVVGGQFIGRIIGDPLTDRFGSRATAVGGAAITLVGMSLALAFPSVPGTLAGFAAAGFGVATLIPAAMETADSIPGLRAGTGLTIVSWLLRLGFLGAPPLVGLVADTWSLRVGLLGIPLAGLVAILCSWALRRKARA